MDVELHAKVQRLYAVYAWAVDQGDFGLLDAIITTDIVITRGGADYLGHEAFVQVYRNSWEGEWSASKHSITNVMATREEDGSIRGQAYFNATSVRSDRTSMTLGRYDDTYSRIGGRWVFATRSLRFMYVVPFEAMGTSFGDQKRIRWPELAFTDADIPESLPTWEL